MAPVRSAGEGKAPTTCYPRPVRLRRPARRPARCAGTTPLRRGTAAIEIAAVQSADLPVAYRAEHQRDLGPGRHSILRHDGKLWWPLVDTAVPDIRTARDFLRDLRAGRCDLFVRRGLDHLFLESRRWRQVVHDGYDETLAAVQRNARNLLIVDDGLYAAGGVPLLVEAPPDKAPAGTFSCGCRWRLRKISDLQDCRR